MPEQRDSKHGSKSAATLAQRHGKRLLSHALSLLAAGAVVASLPAELAAPARQAALFLGAYAGFLNLFPHDFTRSAAYLIPILAGVGPAVGFIISGAPWQLTPLWAGLAALVCRLLYRHGQLADVATVLPITLLGLIGFGLDLVALSPMALPMWFAFFGLAAWLGCRSLRSLGKYKALAENPVFKDKAKRQRIMDYSAAIHDLEAKIAETPPDMHPYIGGISDSAKAIIDLMVTRPRNFSDGDLFLARYLAAALRLVEEHTALLADHAGQDAALSAASLARSLDILKRLDNAFKDRLMDLRDNKKLDFEADLAVLDKLLKMDER